MKKLKSKLTILKDIHNEELNRLSRITEILVRKGTDPVHHNDAWIEQRKKTDEALAAYYLEKDKL